MTCDRPDGTEGVQEDSEDDVSKEKESYREVEFDFQKVEQVSVGDEKTSRTWL